MKSFKDQLCDFGLVLILNWNVILNGSNQTYMIFYMLRTFISKILNNPF